MDTYERASAHDRTQFYAHIQAEAKWTPSVTMVEVGRLLNGVILTQLTLQLLNISLEILIQVRHSDQWRQP